MGKGQPPKFMTKQPVMNKKKFKQGKLKKKKQKDRIREKKDHLTQC